MIPGNHSTSKPNNREPQVAASVVPLTATEAVFEALLSGIVSGSYPCGSRLPAERDLARQLGASRPTLREALRKLGEWHLVMPRRGSGIVVQDTSEWMIDVLPACVRYSGEEASSNVAGLGAGGVRDLLRMRRSLMCEILDIVAERVSASDATLVKQRAQEQERKRAGKAPAPTADLDVLRDILQSSGNLPGLWMLNHVRRIYVDLATSLGSILAPPDNYLAAWEGVLHELAEKNTDQAIALMKQYLEGHDERLMALL